MWRLHNFRRLLPPSRTGRYCGWRRGAAQPIEVSGAQEDRSVVQASGNCGQRSQGCKIGQQDLRLGQIELVSCNNPSPIPEKLVLGIDPQMVEFLQADGVNICRPTCRTLICHGDLRPGCLRDPGRRSIASTRAMSFFTISAKFFCWACRSLICSRTSDGRGPTIGQARRSSRVFSCLVSASFRARMSRRRAAANLSSTSAGLPNPFPATVFCRRPDVCSAGSFETAFRGDDCILPVCLTGDVATTRVLNW